MSAEQGMHWQDDDDSEADNSRQDSSVLRDLRSANKAQAKRLKELEEKLASTEKETRIRSVRELLESRNLNPKIAAFVPADLGTDSDAVGKWLDENADVFGGTAEAEPAPPDQPSVAQMRQMDEVGAKLKVPAGANDLLSAISSASTVEELDALIARATGAG